MSEIVLMRNPTYALPEEMHDEIVAFIVNFFGKLPDRSIEADTLLAATLGAIAGATAHDPEHAADAARARNLLINYLRCMEAEANEMPVSEVFSF